MSNLDNKNKNLLVENIIVFFLFTVFLVFNSLKTLSKIFTYGIIKKEILTTKSCLLYTSPSPRDKRQSRMPSSA